MDKIIKVRVAARFYRHGGGFYEAYSLDDNDETRGVSAQSEPECIKLWAEANKGVGMVRFLTDFNTDYHSTYVV